jgi:hypothetical protein
MLELPITCQLDELVICRMFGTDAPVLTPPTAITVPLSSESIAARPAFEPSSVTDGPQLSPPSTVMPMR